MMPQPVVEFPAKCAMWPAWTIKPLKPIGFVASVSGTSCHGTLQLPDPRRAGQCAAEIFQIELGSDELTPRQYVVLVTLAQNEGLSQTQLVGLTGIDRSTHA
jgi:hypothetical protein